MGKVLRLAIGLALLSLWGQAAVHAQEYGNSGLEGNSATTTRQANFEEAAGPSATASDAAPVSSAPVLVAANPTEPATAKAAEPQGQATAAETLAMDDPPADPPKPWTLPQPCFLQQMKIHTGGWIQQGITFNGDHPSDLYNGPNATNDRAGEYQLNQFWMYFVRETNTENRDWDWGGRIDMSYGTDWRFGQCQGLEPTFDDPNSLYGLILPQFYLELAYKDLTVKMGHFATLTSCETVPAPANFFYSHTYIVSAYFDPLLVTGLQAEYKLHDNVTWIGGFNRGELEFENPSDTLDFLGGLKWTSTDKKSTLSAMVQTGKELGFTGVNYRTNCIVYFLHAFNDRLQYTSQYTAGREDRGSVVTPGADADWFCTEQMLVYKLNQKWSAGARYEWADDQDGSRVFGLGILPTSTRGWAGEPGFAGSFHDFSLGLNYRPHPNCTFRPEVRWDGYDGPRNPAGQLPYGHFERSSQFTTAMDLVITY